LIEDDRYIYSITELTHEIKLLLETTIPVIWAEGEISNFKHHSSGHMYFSLKDSGAQIPCVMWRSRGEKLSFMPKDGLKVVAHGRVTVYEKRGAYQLDVAKLQQSGVGDLQLALEALKQKLKEEGLFEPEFKKPLPRYPERIGIVTSPTGAAIEDLINVINRRYPGVELILHPVKVQGDGAADEIAGAIDAFNAYGEVDVLIVGRGGGSLEDLWAFNEEAVARAISRSDIPVVSAVGHEIDFSISDFVADMRAPTPSAAAELVVPEQDELLERIRSQMVKVYRIVKGGIELDQERLKRILSSYGFRRPLDQTRQYQQHLDDLSRTLERAQRHHIEILRNKTESLTNRLNSLAPESILKRGFSICYRDEDASIVRRSGDLSEQDKIRVRFYKGQIRGTVDEIEDK
jgi:exodeoxyribonuclease VII large subunit